MTSPSATSALISTATPCSPAPFIPVSIATTSDLIARSSNSVTDATASTPDPSSCRPAAMATSPVVVTDTSPATPARLRTGPASDALSASAFPTSVGDVTETISTGASLSTDRESPSVVAICECVPSPSLSPHVSEKKSHPSHSDLPGPNQEGSHKEGDNGENEPSYLVLLPPRTDPLNDTALVLTSSEEENPYDNDDLFEPHFLERMRKNYRLKRLRKKLEKQSSLDNSYAEQVQSQTRQLVSPLQRDSSPCYTSFERRGMSKEVNPCESDLDFLMKNRPASPLPDHRTGRNPNDPLPRIRLSQHLLHGKLLVKANTLMAMPYISSASDSDEENSTDYEEIVDSQPAVQILGGVTRERLDTSPARLVQMLGLSPHMRSRTQRVANFVKRRHKRKDRQTKLAKDGSKASSFVDGRERNVESGKSGHELTSYENTVDDMTSTRYCALPETNGDRSEDTSSSYQQKLQTFEELLELCGTVKTHLQTQTSLQGPDASDIPELNQRSGPGLSQPHSRHSPVFGRRINLSSSMDAAGLARTLPPTHAHTVRSNGGGPGTSRTLPRHIEKLANKRSTNGAEEIKKAQLRRIRTVLLSNK